MTITSNGKLKLQMDLEIHLENYLLSLFVYFDLLTYSLHIYHYYYQFSFERSNGGRCFALVRILCKLVKLDLKARVMAFTSITLMWNVRYSCAMSVLMLEQPKWSRRCSKAHAAHWKWVHDTFIPCQTENILSNFDSCLV